MEEQSSEHCSASSDEDEKEGQSKSEVKESVDESEQASFLKQGPGTPSDFSDKSFSTGNKLFFVQQL